MSTPSSLAIATAVGAAAAVLAASRLFPARAARAFAALDRRRCGLALRHCDVMGHAMPYLEGGRGEPLILLHGLGGQKENFSGTAKALRGEYRVIVPDLLGFGGSPRVPDADHSIDAQAARVMAFADALGLRRFHLGGNSMGGFIAAECAARHPDRIASLWLIGPAGLAGPRETDLMRQFRATGEWPLLVEEPADFERLLATVMQHPPFMPAAVRRMLGARAADDRALHRRIARQVLLESRPLDQGHATLATPALILWGSEDRVLDPSGARAFQAFLPHGRVEVMQGAGHAAMMEAPHEAAARYLAFRHGLARPAVAGALASLGT